MNRYLLFYNAEYYPYGGFGDFRGTFATIEEAERDFENAKSKNFGPCADWMQIIDISTLQPVRSKGQSCHFNFEAHLPC